MGGGDGLTLLRRETLKTSSPISARLAGLTDAELADGSVRDHPIWYLINGPLADALTHVGQINAWPRLAGNPCSKVSVSLGLPLEENP